MKVVPVALQSSKASFPSWGPFQGALVLKSAQGRSSSLMAFDIRSLGRVLSSFSDGTGYSLRGYVSNCSLPCTEDSQTAMIYRFIYNFISPSPAIPGLNSQLQLNP